MKRVIFFLTLLLSLVLSPELFGNDPKIAGLYDESSWTLVGKVRGYKIYSRNMPNSDILGFKIEGIIKAPIESIMANIRDVDTSAEWMPKLNFKKTIQDISDREAITYSINDFPWPLDDRDFILHNKLFIHKKKKLLFVISKSIEHKDYPPNDKYVRAIVGYSNMGLRPDKTNPKQHTFFEWSIYGDPKGNIPSFVVNFFQKGFPVDFYQATEKRALEKPMKLRPDMQKMLNQLRKLL